MIDKISIRIHNTSTEFDIFKVLRKDTSGAITGQGSKFFKTRGRHIIKWLAVADLMAALGNFIFLKYCSFSYF